MSAFDLVLFWLVAVVAVAAAVGMLLSRSAVYSALLLIVNFGAIALLYLDLGAPFIAMAQVAVYAGAIMVLFLFVIMLLGAEKVHTRQRMRWQRPLAFGLGALLLALTAYMLIFRSGVLPAPGQVDPSFGSPAQIGATLFGRYLLPFEVTSLLLLVAMIGAVVLSTRRAGRLEERQGGRQGEG